jgi:hypothetical protein
VPEEHDVPQTLELEEVDHVGYVGFEVDLGTGEVHPFAEAGEAERINVMTLISEPAGDGPPTPASEPGATDQHVSGHPKDLLRERPRAIVF